MEMQSINHHTLTEGRSTSALASSRQRDTSTNPCLEAIRRGVTPWVLCAFTVALPPACSSKRRMMVTLPLAAAACSGVCSPTCPMRRMRKRVCECARVCVVEGGA